MRTRILLSLCAALFGLLVLGAVVFLPVWMPPLLERLGVSLSSDSGLLPSVTDGESGMSPPLHVILEQSDAALASGELSEAVRLLEHALTLGGDVPVMRKLFDAFVLLGDRKKAESVLGLLSFRGVPEGTIDSLRGMLLLREGDTDGARMFFEGEPDRPEHAYGLLLTEVLRGAHEEAQASLAVLSRSADPLLRHAAASVQGAYDEFALFEGGREVHLKTLLARSLAQIGQCPNASRMLTDVVSEEKDYRDAWIVLGYCRLMLENAAGGLEAFERAYDLDPEKAETQYFLGLAHERLARRLVPRSSRSEGGSPGEGGSPAERGEGGHREEAERFFRYALQNGFQPQRSVREKLAQFALERGAGEEAAEQYRAIVVAGEADGAVYRALVTLLVEGSNGVPEARELALKARKEIGDEDAGVLDLVGWTALLTGNLDEAATFLNTAVQQNPSLAEAWEHKGMLEEQTGVSEQAIASYRKAYGLSLGVDDERAARVAERHNALVAQ